MVRILKSLSYDLNSSNTVSLTLSFSTEAADKCSRIVILLSITCWWFEGFSCEKLSIKV